MEEELVTTYTEETKYFSSVYEIFKEFFGEENVDMQGLRTYEEILSSLSATHHTQARLRAAIPSRVTILVHFPQVTITNENDRSTEITHLYAKVEVLKDGKLNDPFTLNRSEYSYLHMCNDYMHSHISRIPTWDFSEFQHPCTGSGPINHTIASLISAYNEDLWRLFCLELDRYVHVESLAGVPYHRLESLTLGGSRTSYACISSDFNTRDSLNISDIRKELLARFIKYLIDKHILKFAFVNNGYVIGMSPAEILIKVSNCFIDWYNRYCASTGEQDTLENLIHRNVVYRCKYKDGKIYRIINSRGNNIYDYQAYEGSFVCNFKGQPVTVHICDIPATPAEENTIIILNKSIMEVIVTLMVNVINLRYGNSRQESETGTVQTVRSI